MNSIIENNSYLEKQNYERMKKLILNSKMRYYTDNIQYLVTSLKEKYDFINLSSIIYYIDHYKKLLPQLPLVESHGISLTYLYEVKEELKFSYPECDIMPFENCKEGVMIYKKIK